MTAFAEPVAATNFSFLRGASPGPNMMLTALLLGHAGLGIADRNTVAGVVGAGGPRRAPRRRFRPASSAPLPSSCPMRGLVSP